MEETIDIHGGHRDRIRARIAAGGLDRLQPHEVLEFLLYYVVPRQDVNRLSHSLMDYFGSLRAVLNAAIPDLMQVEGVGGKTAYWLALVGECVGECNRVDKAQGVPLENFMQVFVYACRKYRQLTPPCTMQICLDDACRILYQRIICDSRAWGEPETLREALSDVISSHARNVMMIQFIGNMHADPEDYDKEHAREYGYTLSCAGCRLLDVVLLGDGGISSMRQLGFIPDFSDRHLNNKVCERYLEDMPEVYTLSLNSVEDDEYEFFDV